MLGWASAAAVNPGDAGATKQPRKEIPMSIDKSEIARMTEEHGGTWGINHTRRLLQLVAAIGTGLTYNSEAVWIAAHLHDWGAYAPWAQTGVDHTLRSGQVAEEFLTERGCPQDLKALVLECIALHHTAGSDRSLEVTLMRDADALDFLGVVGVLRDFSKNPRDLRLAYQQVRKRRQKVPAMLHLERAKAIGAERLQQMDDLLREFEAESFGCF
jgi:HD superfamily phosphodiesterase